MDSPLRSLLQQQLWRGAAERAARPASLPLGLLLLLRDAGMLRRGFAFLLQASSGATGTHDVFLQR